MNARTRDQGLAYLRRSTSKQETGIHEQLNWAIAEAGKLEVGLQGTPADLNEMVQRGLCQHKAIFLDDGVTGSDLNRPGFVAFCREALINPAVSHLFVHMSDRFARPELATQAMQLETKLLLAGITIVFHNRVSLPRERGQHYFAEDIQLLYEYTQNGEFLTKLATRVLQTQARLAQQGYRTGGSAPYGFVRVLVDSQGQEIQELLPGTTMRREGCHVILKPKDADKIAVWMQILHLYGEKGWGLLRICNYLNDLGIPSPHAGKTRKFKGQTVPVAGQWTQRTLTRLIDDADIIGMAEYGKKSVGTHRRLGSDGPRTLSEKDRRPDGEAKTVWNDKDQVIAATVREADAKAQNLFTTCQEQRERRGQNRRGITRCADPGKYPLSLRIHDLSPGCGKPLYARMAKKRAVYLCSRYMRSAARDCHRNSVDAEGTLDFILEVLRQRIVLLGGREAIRTRLLALAQSESRPPPSPYAGELALAEANLRSQETELQAMRRNMARASEEVVFKAIECEYLIKNGELEEARKRVERLGSQVVTVEATTPEQEVAAALRLFDEMERITRDAGARGEIQQLLKTLNLNVWLRFGARPTTGGRVVRVVESGILTIGDGPNPRPMHQEVDGTQPPSGGCGGVEQVFTLPGDESHQEPGGITIGNHGERGASAP